MTDTKPAVQLDALALLALPVLLTTDLGPRPCALCHIFPAGGLENIGATWQTRTPDGEWRQALVCSECHHRDPNEFAQAMHDVRSGVREYVVKDNDVEGYWSWRG